MIDKKTFVLAVVVSWVLTTVTIILIANFVPTLLQPSSQEPSQFIDEDLLIVMTGSMEPTLSQGDFVRIDRDVNAEDIHVGTKDATPPGDIVAYQRTNDILVHRVIDKEVRTDGTIIFIFHGDANPPGANEQIHEGAIVGKVVEIIPNS